MSLSTVQVALPQPLSSSQIPRTSMLHKNCFFSSVSMSNFQNGAGPCPNVHRLQPLYGNTVRSTIINVHGMSSLPATLTSWSIIILMRHFHAALRFWPPAALSGSSVLFAQRPQIARASSRVSHRNSLKLQVTQHFPKRIATKQGPPQKTRNPQPQC